MTIDERTAALEAFHYDDVYPDPHPHPHRHPHPGVGVGVGGVSNGSGQGLGLGLELGLGDHITDVGEYYIEELNPFSRIAQDNSEDFSPMKSPVKGHIYMKGGVNMKGGDINMKGGDININRGGLLTGPSQSQSNRKDIREGVRKGGIHGGFDKGDVSGGVSKGDMSGGISKGGRSRGDGGLEVLDSLLSGLPHDQQHMDMENISPNRGDISRGDLSSRGDLTRGTGKGAGKDDAVDGISQSRIKSVLSSGVGGDVSTDVGGVGMGVGVGGGGGKGRMGVSGGGSKGVLLLQRRVNRWTQPQPQPGQGLGQRSTSSAHDRMTFSHFGQDGSTSSAQGRSSHDAPDDFTYIVPPLSGKKQVDVTDHDLIPHPTYQPSQIVSSVQSNIPVKSPVKSLVQTDKDFIPYPTYLPALLPTSPPTKTSKNKYQSIRL